MDGARLTEQRRFKTKTREASGGCANSDKDYIMKSGFVQWFDYRK
jgi:hypothetical protein